MNDLHETALLLVSHGKGILAADESIHTANKRLASNNIEQSEEMRRKYRNLFLSSPNIEKYLSGVILFEETLSQKNDDGVLFPKALADIGILPGIKVDQGIEEMSDSPGESITGGLIGLSERLSGYRAKGARFTKWRAVIRIDGDRLPTSHSILENAKRIASYAHTVQEAGMVPIIEPEVLLEGNHSRLRAQSVITETLNTVYSAIADATVDNKSLILKTSMALSGNKSGKIDTPEEVAESTLKALLDSVPSNVPGIVFLSGGQSASQATDNLLAIVKKAHELNSPWPLTFSYARALQGEALSVWGGDDENINKAREVFLSRLRKVSDAVSV